MMASSANPTLTPSFALPASPFLNRNAATPLARPAVLSISKAAMKEMPDGKTLLAEIYATHITATKPLGERVGLVWLARSL